MRAPSIFAVIADGSELKWDCWPRDTGWKYGRDHCISARISNGAYTVRFGYSKTCIFIGMAIV